MHKSHAIVGSEDKGLGIFRTVSPPMLDSRRQPARPLIKSRNLPAHAQQSAYAQRLPMLRSVHFVDPMNPRVLAGSDGSQQAMGRGSGLDLAPAGPRTRHGLAQAYSGVGSQKNVFRVSVDREKAQKPER